MMANALVAMSLSGVKTVARSGMLDQELASQARARSLVDELWATSSLMDSSEPARECHNRWQLANDRRPQALSQRVPFELSTQDILDHEASPDCGGSSSVDVALNARHGISIWRRMTATPASFAPVEQQHQIRRSGAFDAAQHHRRGAVCGGEESSCSVVVHSRDVIRQPWQPASVTSCQVAAPPVFPSGVVPVDHGQRTSRHDTVATVCHALPAPIGEGVQTRGVPSRSSECQRQVQASTISDSMQAPTTPELTTSHTRSASPNKRWRQVPAAAAVLTSPDDLPRCDQDLIPGLRTADMAACATRVGSIAGDDVSHSPPALARATAGEQTAVGAQNEATDQPQDGEGRVPSCEENDSTLRYLAEMQYGDGEEQGQFQLHDTLDYRSALGAIGGRADETFRYGPHLDDLERHSQRERLAVARRGLVGVTSIDEACRADRESSNLGMAHVPERCEARVCDGLFEREAGRFKNIGATAARDCARRSESLALLQDAETVPYEPWFVQCAESVACGFMDRTPPHDLAVAEKRPSASKVTPAKFARPVRREVTQPSSKSAQQPERTKEAEVEPPWWVPTKKLRSESFGRWKPGADRVKTISDAPAEQVALIAEGGLKLPTRLRSLKNIGLRSGTPVRKAGRTSKTGGAPFRMRGAVPDVEVVAKQQRQLTLAEALVVAQESRRNGRSRSRTRTVAPVTPVAAAAARIRRCRSRAIGVY